MTVANDSSLCCTILVVFLEFIPVDQAEISHMNRPQDSSQLPGLYEKALGASSYEPSQLGWLGFQDLASPLFSL